jgi:hypothetical protein
VLSNLAKAQGQFWKIPAIFEIPARAVDQRKRTLAEWLEAQTARDSNGHETAWRLKPCPTPMFVNAAGELDQKHDQDLRDTCVMLLDRAGCDLLTICDITGHSYRSAQTIVKHYRARNAARADSGIDWLELQVRKESLNADQLVCFRGAWAQALSPQVKSSPAARRRSSVLSFQSFLERAQHFDAGSYS